MPHREHKEKEFIKDKPVSGLPELLPVLRKMNGLYSRLLIHKPMQMNETVRQIFHQKARSLSVSRKRGKGLPDSLRDRLSRESLRETIHRDERVLQLLISALPDDVRMLHLKDASASRHISPENIRAAPLQRARKIRRIKEHKLHPSCLVRDLCRENRDALRAAHGKTRHNGPANRHFPSGDSLPYGDRRKIFVIVDRIITDQVLGRPDADLLEELLRLWSDSLQLLKSHAAYILSAESSSVCPSSRKEEPCCRFLLSRALFLSRASRPWPLITARGKLRILSYSTDRMQ